MSMEVKTLCIYPVKSLAGIDVPSAAVTATGLENDRRLLLVDETDSFITQRQYPQLAAVRVSLEDSMLQVTVPDIGTASVELEIGESDDARAIDVFEKVGTGAPVSASMSQLFSDYLGITVELLRNVQPRPIRPDCRVEGASQETGFADGFPELLTTTASLEALQRNTDHPIPMDRFRPNIVVTTTEAYDEDFWREITIGDMTAHVVRACARCTIPNVDQLTGIRDRGSPVTRALAVERGGNDHKGGKRGLFFGQNVIHDLAFTGRLTVGDPVIVIARDTARNFDPLA